MSDTLIHNATVVTVDNDFTIFAKGALTIRQGEIEKVWTPSADEPLPQADETIDAQGAIVMPGLVNAHTHLPMSLFRGLADDLPLQQWLQEHIFPAEASHITPETVALGTRLSCAEMLLGGITTCCDGYFLADTIAQAVAEVGLRAVLAQGVIDFSAPGVPDPKNNVATASDFAQRWKECSNLITPSIFCHSPYTCSAETLQAAKRAADALGVLLQIHVAETLAEKEQCQTEHGCTPVQYLQQLGLLDENTLLVHGVWLDEADIQTIASSGGGMVHCPESNMKLAAGIAPAPDMMAAGISVALGTDGCASNNDLNMFAEMDTAAKLHKVQRLDPSVMDAVSVVRMATIQGAGALGLDGQIGSLTPGKRADLIIVDLNQPHLTPLYHPASHLVYAARAKDVRYAMIDGRWVVKDRQIMTMDLDAVMAEVNAVSRSIKKRSIQKNQSV